MNHQPLVSVICLCYNHERFVRESLESVLKQSYENIELIVVDDASTDGSVEVIRSVIGNRDVQFLSLKENVGNTKAFNRAFRQCSGKYIIDLAADDVFFPERISKQMGFFENCSDRVGVIYSDVAYIDEKGQSIENHFASGKYQAHVGDVYEHLIKEYFIPPPSMMIRRRVLDELNGYDESLAYEDFDFWIRSSRNWDYQFQPEVLTKVRKVSGSLSSKVYTRDDQQLHSSYLICEKIKELNKNRPEDQALMARLEYEIKHAVISANFQEAELFVNLYKRVGGSSVLVKVLNLLNKSRLDLSLIRRILQGK